MILVDQYQDEDLPKDVMSLDFSQREEPSNSFMSLSRSKNSMNLDRWDIETHFYKSESEVKVGFLKSLFKGTTKIVKAGVVQEAKFYRLEKTDSGRDVEIGVAVRLAVAATNFSVDTDLSIPNLTASAQLGLSDTRVGIYVVGSRISIGDILPAPSDLGVENYSTYIQAFETIQSRVFLPENDVYFSPALLGYAED